MDRRRKIVINNAAPPGKKWKRYAVAAVLVIAAAAGVLIYARVRRTAEYIARFGGVREREDLCRALPSLSAERRRGIILAFLHDQSREVRAGAVAAAGKSPPDPAVDRAVEDVLKDEGEAAFVRVQAGGALLSRREVPPSVIDYIHGRISDKAFCAALAPLVGRFYERVCADGKDAAKYRRELVSAALTPSHPAVEYLREAVLNQVERFFPYRDVFVEALGNVQGYAARKFVLAVLKAADGLMRGQAAEDWRQETISFRSPVTGAFVYEAEWAQDIRPNYEIKFAHGRLCLALGEGAGGVMNWLKGLAGTVDVGSARFGLYVPAAGRYAVWADVYFDDKCGNSFGLWFAGKSWADFSDERDVMKKWHWMRLGPPVRVDKGFQRGRLQAWEDGVYIDKIALAPEGSGPPADNSPAAVPWDAAIPSSISFSPEKQAQYRGTTQKVTVWVRRSTPGMQEGAVRLSLPRPFEVVGFPSARIRFAEGNPLCRTTFLVHLPDGVPAGEGLMRAVYTDDGGKTIQGRCILGAQFDWLTTGPLKSLDPVNRRLLGLTTVSDGEIAGPAWKRYPEKGLDPYRRLEFEQAYGPLRDVFIYLVTDVSVAEAGDFVMLLTADDSAWVYMDGNPAVSQPAGGPGEGRMVMRRVHLAAGAHRVFVRYRQSGFHDPEGPDSVRRSQNHADFKLLIRKERHEAAEKIRGLPMSAVKKRDAAEGRCFGGPHRDGRAANND